MHKPDKFVSIFPTNAVQPLLDAQQVSVTGHKLYIKSLLSLIKLQLWDTFNPYLDQPDD